MTFGDAVDSLTIGKATKLPSWRGYVAKQLATDSGAKTSAPDWDADHTGGYAVGDMVTYGGQIYICIATVEKGTGSMTWDSTKWKSTELDYDLVFTEASDPTGKQGGDSTTEYKFRYRQSVADSAVAWTITAPGDPESSVSSSEKALEIDKELLPAFMSSNWTVGNTSDYKAVKDGTTRW